MSGMGAKRAEMRCTAALTAAPMLPYYLCRMSMSKMGAKRAARKRQRKQMPFAWGVRGEGGDFDQVSSSIKGRLGNGS